MSSKSDQHIPVLLDEVLILLQPSSGMRILDCTLGLAGHASALLEAAGESSTLCALDADQANLETAKEHLSQYSDRIQCIHSNFAQLQELDLGTFDIILADLGLSSVHLDDPSKGFSFREDGPLDMRLDQSRGESAAGLIQRLQDGDLADVLFHYGEIRQSRKLASAIKEVNPTTTSDLVKVCENVFSFRAKNEMPKVFQALRIAVNDELRSLEILLQTAPGMLNTKGRLGIISFHSLEDRRVKETFKELCTGIIDDTTGQTITEAPFALVTRKAIKPSEREIEKNPRSRSARFRVIEKR